MKYGGLGTFITAIKRAYSLYFRLTWDRCTFETQQINGTLSIAILFFAYTFQIISQFNWYEAAVASLVRKYVLK